MGWLTSRGFQEQLHPWVHTCFHCRGAQNEDAKGLPVSQHTVPRAQTGLSCFLPQSQQLYYLPSHPPLPRKDTGIWNLPSWSENFQRHLNTHSASRQLSLKQGLTDPKWQRVQTFLAACLRISFPLSASSSIWPTAPETWERKLGVSHLSAQHMETARHEQSNPRPGARAEVSSKLLHHQATI